MLVWRLTRAAYQMLDGEGARLNGGRWNSEGVAVVYTSTTLALAALEYLVHVDPEDLVAVQMEIPDDVSAEQIELSDLPPDWNVVLDHPACLKVGDAWAKTAATAVLRVPSAVVPEEEIVLINPRHPDAGRMAVIHTRAFSFDRRLLT